MKQEIDDEKKEGSIESEPDLIDDDPHRLLKKSQNVLIRSDSTGSAGGRKYLAPSLSDPQPRNPKETFTSNKKKQPVRPATTTAKPNIPHFNELPHHHNHNANTNTANTHAHGHEQTTPATKPTPIVNQTQMIYEVHEWWIEQVLCTQSSDEE